MRTYTLLSGGLSVVRVSDRVELEEKVVCSFCLMEKPKSETQETEHGIICDVCSDKYAEDKNGR